MPHIHQDVPWRPMLKLSLKLGKRGKHGTHAWHRPNLMIIHCSASMKVSTRSGKSLRLVIRSGFGGAVRIWQIAEARKEWFGGAVRMSGHRMQTEDLMHPPSRMKLRALTSDL
eukprot:1159453-Pelagomonas_calceolata.AAC.3